MNLIALRVLCERHVVARLVEVYEGVGVHGHLLRLGGRCDVNLLCLLHVGPLCLAVEPYGSHRGVCVKLVSLYGY